jgi:hypothetical protein
VGRFHSSRHVSSATTIFSFVIVIDVITRSTRAVQAMAAAKTLYWVIPRFHK